MSRDVEGCLLIGIGGFVGANARYWISGWAAERFGQVFPWGTLLVNVSGACLLAFFYGWAANHVTLDPRVRLTVGIGFFGAYTTFSTFATESSALLLAGDWIGATGNILVTNLACVLGALIGFMLGRTL